MRNVDKDDIKFLCELYGIGDQEQMAMHMAVLIQASNTELAGGILTLLDAPATFDMNMVSALLYVVAMRLREADQVKMSYN